MGIPLFIFYHGGRSSDVNFAQQSSETEDQVSRIESCLTMICD